MWPSSHIAIGYLFYSGYTHLRFRRSPEKFPTLLVLIGSLLPDLIDKPLWLSGVVSTGRTFGHSLLFIFPLIAAVGAINYWLRRDTDPVIAFGVSVIAASIFDGIQQFLQGSLAGDLEEVSFWVWPLAIPSERIVERIQITPNVASVIEHKPVWTAKNIPQQPELALWIRAFELAATIIVICVWVFDGVPGWRTCRYLGQWARESITPR